jgi:hypothetical protein
LVENPLVKPYLGDEIKFVLCLFAVTAIFTQAYGQFPMTIWAVNDDVDGALQYYTLELNNIFLISCYFPYIIYYSNKIIYIHLGKEMIRMDIKHYWRTK